MTSKLSTSLWPILYTMLEHLRKVLSPKPYGDNASATKVHASNDAVNGNTQLFELGDFAIDEYRPMKIVAIGAGMGGILAGIRYFQVVLLKQVDFTYWVTGFVNTSQIWT